MVDVNKWNNLADKKTIEKTIAALKANGIDAVFVQNGEEAKKKALELIPQGAEVMAMTSMTCDAIGLTKEINESGKYDSVRKKLMAMDRNTQGREMRKLGSAPDFAVGSAHAITQDGDVLIASATGSQLPAYASGAGNVIFVVGTQKIVKNTEEGFRRIYEHCLLLESERARKAYGIPADKPGSSVNKMLVINKEYFQKRITLILVDEILGF
jgi:hypothetical protein